MPAGPCQPTTAYLRHGPAGVPIVSSGSERLRLRLTPGLAGTRFDWLAAAQQVQQVGWSTAAEAEQRAEEEAAEEEGEGAEGEETAHPQHAMLPLSEAVAAAVQAVPGMLTAEYDCPPTSPAHQRGVGGHTLDVLEYAQRSWDGGTAVVLPEVVRLVAAQQGPFGRGFRFTTRN